MQPKNSRINELDLLRFIAALSVVFYHYAFRGYAADSMTTMPYPPLADISKYGQLGVQLFFMISGFVILMSAADGSLRRFITSRIVRLYPAFWACCTITFLAILIIGGSQYSATAGQYLVNMTMLSGFIGVPSIDDVYWSLFVEIKFYALVALVLLAGRIHQAQTLIAFWLALSIALELYPIGKLRYILIVEHSAYFIAGATCYLIRSEGLSVARALMIAGSYGLAIFQASRALVRMEEHFNAPMSLFVVAVMILVLFTLMLLISLGRTGAIGRTRWVLIGSLTYPLYLLHQNIGFMIFNMTYPGINMHLIFWGTIAAMLILAYAVHEGMERRLAPPMKLAIDSAFDRVHRLLAKHRTGNAAKRQRL